MNPDVNAIHPRKSADIDEPEPIEVAKDRAYWLTKSAEDALEAGQIDEAEWHRRISAVITPAYLAADTPWGQSGKSGDEQAWTYGRSLICDAIHRDGSFLDVGCANGYLMESIHKWTAERGHCIEPYGLDISPELADLARTRLPHWAERIHTGNVLTWPPTQRFDFVRTGLEYVPSRRRRDLVQRLVDEFLAEDGRLIIGGYSVESAAPDSLEQELSAWGFTVSGHTTRPHRDDRLVNRILWIDA